MPKIDVNGVNIYYEEAGSGVPILFLHEFAGDYRSWEPQMRFFARRNRCITLSYRGYPPSDIPDDPDAYSQDIFLDDITVSRHHCTFDWEHDELSLEDAGSTNGTYVNGSRVDSAVLNPGDEVLVGRFHLVVAHGDA